MDESTIRQIVETQDRFGCIECGAKYFHTPGCRHGLSLSGPELMTRLHERAALLPPMEMQLPCDQCGKPAQGTLWVLYHRSNVVVSALPYCEQCSTLFYDDRPFGFWSGLVTKSTLEIQQLLTAT